MRSLRVVVFPPLLNDDLRLFQAVEDFPVEELISKPCIEALAVPVLPRGSRFDVSCLCTHRLDPVSDGLCHKLRPVIRPNERRNAADDEQVRQNVDHICRVEFSLHTDRQALSAVFIDDVERPEGSAVICTVMHEVIGPDMITICWFETDA